LELFNFTQYYRWIVYFSTIPKSKFDNDPELVEEWETLQLDEVSVATEDLLPADRYWQRANDLDVELGRKIEVNETGGFSNTPNIQGYGVLRFEDFSPSPNTAFSGVFDVDAGRFMVYPSGSTRYANGGQIPNGSIVPRRGGHRSIRNKMMDYYDDLSSLSKLTLQLKLKSLRVNQAIKIYNWQVSFVGLLS
jgi:hypothetical protein